MILSGTLSNLLLLVTVIKTRYVSGHASGVLLLALCLVDLYVVFVSAPLLLLSTLQQKHLFGQVGCLVTGYLDNAVTFIGLWCIASSSIDRLVAVSQPLLYKQVVKKGRALLTLICICIVSAGATSLIFFANKTFNMCTFDAGTLEINLTEMTIGEMEHSTDPHQFNLYATIYQVFHSILPLSISLIAYIGIFLAARNLRTRELARKKVLEKMKRRRTQREENNDIEEVNSSIESGIDMAGSLTFSEISDGEEDLPIERRSTTSSNRKSMVVNNDKDRRSKGSIKFGNTTVFMESIHNTFFNTNLMEELNRLHEDYFSLSQEFETARTDTTDDLEEDDPCITIDPESRTVEPVVPTKVPCKFHWRKRQRSVTALEKLQIKTAVLLAAVVVVIVGSHIPTLMFEMSRREEPVTGRFSLLLPLVVYSVNPLLFGFLNNTLRSKAIELVTKIFKKPDSQTGQDSSNTATKRDSMAAFRRLGRRISVQAALLKEFKIKRLNSSAVGPLEIFRTSDISILSQRSVIRDQMTLKYFETNL